MPSLVSSLPFIPVRTLCTCHSRSGLYRQQTHIGVAKRNPQTCHKLHAQAFPVAQATTATQQATATQQPQQTVKHTQALPQEADASARASDSAEQAAPSAPPARDQPNEVLNPMNYPGTSNKARRKALVQYLSTIPEDDMSPEMLRRWRISKANRGKAAWNYGRRHPPGALCILSQLNHATNGNARFPC